MAVIKQVVEKASNSVEQSHVCHLRSTEPVGKTVAPNLTLCI